MGGVVSAITNIIEAVVEVFFPPSPKPIYEDRPIFEDLPVYESRPVYRTEPVYGIETVYTTQPVYKTRTIYRKEPVYRTETYRIPDPPRFDYIPITDASTYISAGDYIKYIVPTDGVYDPLGAPSAGNEPEPPGLKNGRIYKVKTANTTGIVITNPSVDDVTPVTWTAKPISQFSTVQQYHKIALISGQAITGANSFISISSANSWFTPGDPIKLFNEGDTYLLDPNITGVDSRFYTQTYGPVGPYTEDYIFYVKTANSSGISLSKTLGGPRVALVQDTLTQVNYATGAITPSLTFYLEGSNNLCGTISSLSSSLFSVGDEVQYRTDTVSSSGLAPLGLQDQKYYYIQFANSTHVALTGAPEGNRLVLRPGSGSSHSLVAAKAGNGAISITSANTYYQQGDTVVYNISVGGTALTGLTPGNEYTIQLANSTHLALAEKRKLQITLRANTNFVVGDIVYQRPNENTPNTAVGLIETVSGNTITIDTSSVDGTFAPQANIYSTNDGNQYLISITTNPGPRLALKQGLTETHSLTGVNVIRTASTFAPGEFVQYVAASGNATINTTQNVTLELAANTGFTTGSIVYQRPPGSTTNNAVGTIVAVSGNTIIVNANTYYGGFVTTSNTYTAAGGNQTTANVMINLVNNAIYQINSVNSSSFSLNTASTLTDITITAVGTGYTNDDIVVVTDGAPASPAMFKLVTDATGSIVSYNMITSGYGYTRTPLIQLTNLPGSGGSIIAGVKASQTLTLVKNTHATGHSFIPVNTTKNIIQGNVKGIYANDGILYFTSNHIAPLKGLTNNTIYYADYVSDIALSLKSSTTSARINLSGDYTGNVIITVAANTNFNVGDDVYQRNDGTTNNASGKIIGISGNDLVVNSASIVGKFNYSSNVYSTNAIPGNRVVGNITYSTTLGSRSGHNFVLVNANNTIMTSLASSLTAGDTVLYRVDTGNTAIVPLQHNVNYYVNFANSTHVALSRISGGTRLPLRKGKFETGHRLYKTSGLSSVIASSNAQQLAVGDYVKYTAQQAKTKLTLAAGTNFNVGDDVYQRNNGTTNNATGRVVSVSGSTVTLNVQTMTGTFNTLSNVYSTNTTPGNQSVTSVDFGNIQIKLSATTNFNAGDTVYQRDNGAVNSAVGQIVSVGGGIITVNTSTIIGEFNNSTNVYSTNATPGNQSVVEVYPVAANGMSTNTFYYVQFANATHFALSETDGGSRLLITKGSDDVGHRIKAYGRRSTIAVSTAKYFTAGDQVKYVIASGNTPVIGLSNTATYYIESANDTHISLAATLGGDRLDLSYLGSNETGHWISPQGTKGTIRASNQFTVGDVVTYTIGVYATSLRGLTPGNDYYVEFANSTHFAVSTFTNGPRVDLYKSAIADDHVFASSGSNGTIYSASAVDFTVGDRVQYITSPGNTAITGLANNGVYIVQYKTSTQIALTSRTGGYRIPITKGLTQSGHKIVKLGSSALINVPLANNLQVDQPVIYTSSNLSANLATKAPSGYLTSGTTYYVQFANATHVGLTSTPGGERIVIAQQASSGTTHTLSDASINTVTIAATSTHSNVRFTPAGTLINVNTAVTGTIANVSVYT